MKVLKHKIIQRTARVGVIGQGYVGLPLALEIAEGGFPVTGFEIDSAKVKMVRRGISYIQDVSNKDVLKMVKAKKLDATTDFKRLAKMDIILICVPTPLRKSKDPDISYIVSAVEKIVNTLQKGQLIILESTTYPGTTREIILPRIEGKGLKVGRDFFLAFSPERVDPGNQTFGIKNTPKVVGGITPRCTQMASEFYGTIVDKVVPVSTTESAEMVKLLENTFRAVNIGLVNEVALMCDRLKLDAWEVIDAAATKPFGFMPFYPGPGLGGHCIPLDPHYLSWKLRTLNFYSRFIELASEINSRMPEYLLSRISNVLNHHHRSIKNSKVLILGAAYKKDVGDVRESPALDVMELLIEKGAQVCYHDPFVSSFKIRGQTYKSAPYSVGLLGKMDCVVITTNHRVFNIQEVVDHSKLIVDSRNATKGITNPKITKL